MSGASSRWKTHTNGLLEGVIYSYLIFCFWVLTLYLDLGLGTEKVGSWSSLVSHKTSFVSFFFYTSFVSFSFGCGILHILYFILLLYLLIIFFYYKKIVNNDSFIVSYIPCITKNKIILSYRHSTLYDIATNIIY